VARHDAVTVTEVRPGPNRAGVLIRAVLGGAAAAWLVVLGFLVLLAVRPHGEPLSLRGVASTVAAVGWLPGLAIAVLAPVAAALAVAVRRIPGGGAIACAVVGAAAGLAVDAAFYGPNPRTAVWAAGVLSAAGVVGWFASPWASRSGIRVLLLVAVAAGVWTTALLLVMATAP